MNFFQHKLIELIKEADEKWNLYTYMGWDSKWVQEFRHLYLKCLLKDQLKHFDRS